MECREMCKHELKMVEDISHMAIPLLVETRLLSENVSTSGWSHKTWKNRLFEAD
jgi:hypothetical protein